MFAMMDFIIRVEVIVLFYILIHCFNQIGEYVWRKNQQVRNGNEPQS